MTNYRRGYITENKAVNQLKKMGYTAVRTAGSHSPFDVIAWKQDEVRFIQLKRTKKWKNYNLEVKQISEQKVPKSVKLELWVWVDRKGFTKVEIEKGSVKQIIRDVFDEKK
jgi:Holliday junction resolvase